MHQLRKKLLCLLVLGFSLPLMVVGKDNCCSGELIFKENKGQWHSNAQFRTNIPGGSVFFESNAFTYSVYDNEALRLIHPGARNSGKGLNNAVPNSYKSHAFKMFFKDANPNPQIEGVNKLASYSNYFIGETVKHASNVAEFNDISYERIYDYIDLDVYSTDNFLKYEFVVYPKGNVTDIAVGFEGLNDVCLKDGDLYMQTSVGEIIEFEPYAYQIIGVNKVEVACDFVLKDGELTYAFPNGYNQSETLIIDPTMVFATYSGSTADNFGFTATYDDDQNAYAGGIVFATGYPVTMGAAQVPWNGGGVDIGITKYNPAGTARIYATYLGGNGGELPHSLIANSLNELFIMGTTGSSDFPTSLAAYDTSYNGGPALNLTQGIGVNFPNGSDIFVSRLSADGTLLQASTLIGGTDNDGLNATTGSLRYNYADEARGEVLIDGQNNVYVVSNTNSTDFPVTGGVIQNTNRGMQDGVVFKMDNNLTSVIWSTYHGGNGNDACYSVALTRNDDVIVAGGTVSTDLPITLGAYQTTFQGGRSDGFISKISKNGNILISSTYAGTFAYDQIYFVDIDKQEDVYVLGQTEDTTNSFIFNTLYNNTNSGQFITKLDRNLNSMLLSSTFGTGSNLPDISPTAFLVDVCNKIYVAGWGGTVNGFGGTTGLDTTAGAFQTTTDNSDFYLMVVDININSLNYATFIGEQGGDEHVDGGTSRFDKNGLVYQSVCSSCAGTSGFPTTPGVPSPTNPSPRCSNAIFKFDLEFDNVIANFKLPTAICAPFTDTLINTSRNATSYFWNLGVLGTSTATNPVVTFNMAGTYPITLVAIDSASCNGADTITKTLVVLGNSSGSLPDVPICDGGNAQIGVTPSVAPGVTYVWSPSTGLTDTTASNPIASPLVNTIYTLIISNGTCIDTLTQLVTISPPISGVTVGSANTGCASNCNGSAQLTVGGGFAPFTILWDNGETGTMASALCSGNHTVLVTDSNGCQNSFSVMIEDSAEFEINGVNDQICFEDDCNGVLSANVVKGQMPFTYLWNDPAMQTTQMASGLCVGVYQCIVTDALGCSDTIELEVTADLPSIIVSIDKDTIPAGASTNLNATNLNGATYLWEPGATLTNSNTANTTASPNETTTYILTVTDINGCVSTDTVTVYVLEFDCDESTVYLPNAFTPNDDGENDLFRLRTTNAATMHLMVYNRWGEKVFETRNQSVGWDGKYLERESDPGVFGYYLEVDCFNGVNYIQKGNVTLIR